jgi:hypothetical protein
MIDYAYDLLIPANTLQSNPVTVDARLGKGTLEQIYIGFPEGCGTMVSVCLEYRGFQFAPIIPNQAYHIDGNVISIDTEQELDYEPFSITIKGWSPGTLYQHTISFILCVNPSEDNDALATLANLLAVHHA